MFENGCCCGAVAKDDDEAAVGVTGDDNGCELEFGISDFIASCECGGGNDEADVLYTFVPVISS